MNYMRELVGQLQRQKEEVKRKRAAGFVYPEKVQKRRQAAVPDTPPPKQSGSAQRHGVTFNNIELERTDLDEKKQSLAEWDHAGDLHSPLVPIASMNETPHREGNLTRSRT